MIDIIQIIKNLQATDGRLEKEKILSEAWRAEQKDLFKGLYYCYNPFITLGVADKVVTKKSGMSSETTFQDFESLLSKLSERKLTGNSAKEEIENFAAKTDKETWELFFRPILLKDIRAGLSEKTINKILKSHKDARSYMIPVFEVQLAHDGVDEVIEGQNILQDKLDGVRLITLCDKENNKVTTYTRNGKENHNFPHIKKVFEDLLPELDQGMLFDGEVVGETFQSLMKQVNRKEDVNSKVAKLAVFDCLPLSDFRNGISNTGQLQRIEMLDKFSIFSEDNQDSPVFKLESLIVDMTTTDGKKKFDEFNQKAITAGKEGIMVKKVDAAYECKRSKNWLKIKPFLEETLEIIECQEGTGKNIGRLGNINCKGEINGKKIEVSVGSGFSEEEREEIWKDRENLKGVLIEVRCDCLTLNENSDNIWSMRFPRFKGFRGSVPGEKL